MPSTGMVEATSPVCGGVLIVEDDPDIRETIRDLLIDEGYAVETAANGLLGLQALQQVRSPYLVLLDMMMPVLDGTGFLARVRQDPVRSSWPILLVSAVAKDGEPGTVGAMRKPIDVEVLLGWVRRFCAPAT